jgi:alpha-glucan,water dikinase
MNRTETINTQSGFVIQVEARTNRDNLEVSFQGPATKKCLLHWGLRRSSEGGWQLPAEALWPVGSIRAPGNALDTPFAKQNGQAGVLIRLGPAAAFDSIEFVLFFPDEQRWDNNRGQNYQVALQPSPSDALRESIAGQEAVFERDFQLDGPWRLAVAVTAAGPIRRLFLVTNVPGELVLHWGVARRSPREWMLPEESTRGKDTVIVDNSAQTPFTSRRGFNFLQLEFPEAELPVGIQFVVKMAGKDGRWLKHRGSNFFVPLERTTAKTSTLGAPELGGLADEIIQAETSHNSWTLMHRFNLCYDLIDRVQSDREGFALLYVWLRFSAIRQLTWQRNYNTKPRELAHAQERLTSKLADLYQAQPALRPLVRLALTTVGRGGEGQRIRDEVLNIMHRHHVKEVSGHFLEEWHQKLHNNTTPDDVVICQAFLEFLRSNGNLDRFYQTLGAGGVTRERLESFERPIRSQPQFVPHLKDGLIHDFQDFLRILKASHSGTDFETALNSARNQVDAGLQQQLNYLWEHRDDPNVPLPEFVKRITGVRRDLSNIISGRRNSRELLYLDLALEQLLRGVVERSIHLELSGESLANLIASVLENVTLSHPEAELVACSHHWRKLQSVPRFSAAWSLHSKSVMDRIARALGVWMDQLYQLLQPKAEFLGCGFQAEDWTIKLFSEEVVRGSSLGFVLSILLRHLDPMLRKAAHLGDWQVVSPGHGAGKLEAVPSLRSIQHQRFDTPTVIVTDSVSGDEDIPEGVIAVLAPDVTDIVSHVAVRARNAHLLFASCHDENILARLKSMRGRFVQLDVTPAGDVLVKEAGGEAAVVQEKVKHHKLSIEARSFTKYALELNEFNEALVGGKASHLAQLRGKLPNSIHLPASVAVPFGVFEQVLTTTKNREVAARCRELAEQAGEGGPDVLARLRETILTLAAPDELIQVLRQTMAKANLAWPEAPDKVFQRIKQVWASKWNDRAFLSRNRLGFPHDRLHMAVLIQQVVPADYAFVLHTANPLSGNADELFAEVVLGLGETLVGNYPGRALSFIWDKTSRKSTLLSYPGKSAALYGGGLIFRSDSNGEDLEGYAGAGLYDSVLLDPPKQVVVDYTDERLVWDESFRSNLFAAIARIGREVEKAFGSPQDIEGAVTKGNYYVVQTRPQVGLTKSTPPQNPA